jgi:hypothetical protein
MKPIGLQPLAATPRMQASGLRESPTAELKMTAVVRGFLREHAFSRFATTVSPAFSGI